MDDFEGPFIARPRFGFQRCQFAFVMRTNPISEWAYTDLGQELVIRQSDGVPSTFFGGFRDKVPVC